VISLENYPRKTLIIFVNQILGQPRSGILIIALPIIWSGWMLVSSVLKMLLFAVNCFPLWSPFVWIMPCSSIFTILWMMG